MLNAFSAAYTKHMYGELVFDETDGQARDTIKLPLRNLYEVDESRFGLFVADYTERLG